MDTVVVMTRILIVDDDPLVRSALGLMLGGQPDLDVIGEAADGKAGVTAAQKLKPDVVLMDIRMPVMDGLEATRILRSAPEGPRVVVLTTFDADEYVLDAIAAGAEGFLLKDTPPPRIVDAIRHVAAGSPMLSPSATATLIRQVRERPTDPDRGAAASRVELLTERELEIAIAVGRGLSNADIAEELFLSVGTVKSHVSRLLEKLGLNNRVQVALAVHDAGLL